MSELLLETVSGLISTATPDRVPYDTIRPRLDVQASSSERNTALADGIRSAEGWLNDLRRDTAGGEGVAHDLRARVVAETRVAVDPNPYVGVAAATRIAYQAVSDGALSDPWLLLALWVKEGSAQRDAPGEVAATTPKLARAAARAGYFYDSMGLDAFTSVTAAPGVDNDFTGDPAQQLAAFRAELGRLQGAGYLNGGLEQWFDSVMDVSRRGAGRYGVTVGDPFYALCIVLADALYREHADIVSQDTRVGASAPAIVYAHWNMGAGRFGSMVDWFEQHAPRGTGGSPLSFLQWLTQSRAAAGTAYAVPRANAIRFQYYLDAYRAVFAGPG